MTNVVGAYYLHENGKLVFKPVIAFANDPDYFKSPFVKHVWAIMIEPPAPTKKGQLRWLLKDFLQVAYEKGAELSEVIRIASLLKNSDQFKIYLPEATPDDIARVIVEDKIDDFLNAIPELNDVEGDTPDGE
jgi:hypothetical protein